MIVLRNSLITSKIMHKITLYTAVFEHTLKFKIQCLLMKLVQFNCEIMSKYPMDTLVLYCYNLHQLFIRD